MRINNDDAFKCRDCGEPFIVTAGEREFYEARGHPERQKFCRECRIRRRAQPVTRLPRRTGIVGAR